MDYKDFLELATIIIFVGGLTWGLLAFLYRISDRIFGDSNDDR